MHLDDTRQDKVPHLALTGGINESRIETIAKLGVGRVKGIDL